MRFQFFFLLLGSTSGGATDLEKYVNWDSGLYPGLVAARPVWLDENAVVYNGYQNDGRLASKLENFAQASKFTQAIVIWRMGERPIAHVDDRWLAFAGNKFVCGADGVLAYPVGYSTGADGRRLLVMAEGTPGHMADVLIDSANVKTFKDVIDAGAPIGPGYEKPCDSYRDPRMAGHFWIADYDRRHYLDFGRNLASNEPIKLLSSNEDMAPVNLSVTTKEAPPSCDQYHRFSGLFYLIGCANQDSAGWSQEHPCLPYWTLDPIVPHDEKHCVLFNAKIGSPFIELVPTKKGMYFVTADQTQSVDDIGLYKVTEFGSILVIRGFIQKAAVSPSGCRLVFAFSRYVKDISLDSSREYSYRVVDLCQEKS